MNPLVGLVLLPIAAAIVGATRYVSLMSIATASIGAALFLALAIAGLLPFAYAAFAIAVAVLIILLHHDNIQRLLTGTERKIGQKAQV